MNKIFGNTLVFVLIYTFFMIPTYILPYVGSNSVLAYTSEAGSLGYVFLHALSLLVLIVVTWFRGANMGKAWLVAFPFLASIFDMMPVLNSIPLLPTIMHMLALILGVVGTTALAVENSTN